MVIYCYTDSGVDVKVYNGAKEAIHNLETGDFSKYTKLVLRSGTLLSDKYADTETLTDFIKGVYAQSSVIASMQYDFDKSDTFITKDDMRKRIIREYPEISDGDIEAMLYVMLPDVFIGGWSDDSITAEIHASYEQLQAE